jgi:hypothetical protein
MTRKVDFTSIFSSWSFKHVQSAELQHHAELVAGVPAVLPLAVDESRNETGASTGCPCPCASLPRCSMPARV